MKLGKEFSYAGNTYRVVALQHALVALATVSTSTKCNGVLGGNEIIWIEISHLKEILSS